MTTASLLGQRYIIPSSLCLPSLLLACLSWSSERMGDLSGSDSRYRVSEIKAHGKVGW
ncbi:hypothetical protein YC2023_081058 [Brassica napus]